MSNPRLGCPLFSRYYCKLWPALADGSITLVHVRDGLHDEDARLVGCPDNATVQGQPGREAERRVYALYRRFGQQGTLLRPIFSSVINFVQRGASYLLQDFVMFSM